MEIIRFFRILHEPGGKARIARDFLLLSEEIIEMIEHILTGWATSTRRMTSAAEFETGTRTLRAAFLAVAFLLLGEIRVFLGHLSTHGTRRLLFLSV